jgi:excisionase family DNA binding protein
MPKLKQPSTAPAAVERAPVPKLCLSVPESAISTGLSKSYLYLAMKDGRLNYLKAGARRLIPVSELQAFLGRLPQGA